MLPDKHPFWHVKAEPLPSLERQKALPYADMLIHRYPGHMATALYYVALKMVKNQEGYLWKSFWHSYWDNLKPTTGIWCILLIVGMGLGISFRMLFQMEGSMKSMFIWGLAVLVLVYLFVLTLIFPLMARLNAGINRLFVMTFMAAVKIFHGCFLWSFQLFVFWHWGYLFSGPFFFLERAALPIFIR